MPNSISTNLARLQQAKTDIGTAIGSSGYDVPSGSTLTTYPTTITTINNNINGALESCLGDGGSGVNILIDKTITTNGIYSPSDDNALGYSEVSVDVANSYTASDEGKVVSSGSLVAQTSTTATENGTIDTTTNNQVVVNVPNIAIRGNITCSKSEGTNNNYAYRIGNVILFSLWTNITSNTSISFRDYSISGLCNGDEIVSSAIFSISRVQDYNESSPGYNCIVNSHDQTKVVINKSTGNISFNTSYLTDGSYPAIMLGSITLASQ